jgi:polysaccharide pyruvyl transferase WcaK-like protein
VSPVFTTSGPRIGLWGRFDVASFGDLIVPRVFENEMRRRLPRMDVQTYAPLGPRHPVALDGGYTARALGTWSRRRVAELAEGTDCVVIGGGDVIHTHEALFAADYGMSADEVKRLRPSSFFIEGLGRSLERRCPIAWNAVGVPFRFQGEEAARLRAALGPRRYLSVRDLSSKKRLRDAGVEARIEVVPDPSLLAARAFPSELLVRRLDYLKFMDWFPSAVEPLVLQGAGHLVPRARSIARSMIRALRGRSIPIVLLETESGRGETEFLDAIAPHLGDAVFRVPSSVALSDIAAVLAHARAFVGSSRAASLAAASFGVPVLRLESDGGRARITETARMDDGVTTLSVDADLAASVRRLVASRRREGLPRDLEERLETHFDRLAEIAESAVLRRLERVSREHPRVSRAGMVEALRDAEERIEDARTAYAARGEQMLQQRFRLVEALEQREAELRTELREEAHSERAILSGALAQIRADLEASYAREVEAQRTMEASRERELEALRTMERLERDLSDATRTLEGEVAARERLLTELSAREQESGRLAGELARVTEERSGLLSDLAASRSARDSLEAELRSARERSERSEQERLRADEERSRAESAAKVLGSELERLRSSLARTSSREARLSSSRFQALAELKESRADLEKATRELEFLRADRQDELLRLRDQLQALHSELSRMTDLRVFRYSAPFRAIYRTLRRLVRSSGESR